MRPTEAFSTAALGTGESSHFALTGGRYQFQVATATFGGGNVVVQQLGCDGAIWLPVATALTAVGANVFEVPPGQFRFFSVTATAIDAMVARIPGE